jgi:hypothetical protein
MNFRQSFFPVLFAILAFASSFLRAQTVATNGGQASGQFRVTFTADPAAVGQVEWIVEAKTGATWREVAATRAIAPLDFADTVTVGATYSIRMRTRSIEAPSFLSEPSAESAVTIPAALAPPGSVQLKILVTITVTP